MTLGLLEGDIADPGIEAELAWALFEFNINLGHARTRLRPCFANGAIDVLDACAEGRVRLIRDATKREPNLTAWTARWLHRQPGIDAEPAWALFEFNIYLWQARPRLEAGHTFSRNMIGAQRYVLRHVADERYPHGHEYLKRSTSGRRTRPHGAELAGLWGVGGDLGILSQGIELLTDRPSIAEIDSGFLRARFLGHASAQRC